MYTSLEVSKPEGHGTKNEGGNKKNIFENELW